MISCATVQKPVIRRHYNVSTLFYRLLWGPHIHHGLFEQNDSPRVAAQRLTDRVAAAAGIQTGQTVIDIGCGMGGSSIHLARTHNCQVTGVTISPLQKQWATVAAALAGTRRNTTFVCADAETVQFNPATFDVGWSIECTEHLFDKPAFFQRLATWLKPGGTVAICAWLAGDEPLDQHSQDMVQAVCENFFCPSLGTTQDYQQWMSAAGLQVRDTFDWTDQVARTWEICHDRVQRTHVRSVARIIDRGQLVFLDHFPTILNAYRTKAMRYGCFIADKPDSP